MPVYKVNCPECEAVLKSPKGMTPGKKIKCPKCNLVFPVPADEEEPTPAVKPAGKDAGAGRAAPPAKKKTTSHDDDGGGVYAVIRDPEEEKKNEDDDDDEDEDEEKPDLTFALDLSVKDPRGPAQAKVVSPSNALIAWGALIVILNLIGFCWAVFPFIFSNEWVEIAVEIGVTAKEGQALPVIERKSLSKDKLAMVEAAEEAFMVRNIIVAIVVAVQMILGGLIVFGGVKMQMLESYGWAMTSSILCIVFGASIIGIGVLIGIWCLIVLNDPKVKEGFRVARERADEVY
jgi:phage FluMu protein Com